jgi:hypothetical protein
LVKLLKNSDSNELRKGLTDPHLLLHLSTLLDDDCSNLLCKFVNRGSGIDKIPAKLSMALDFLKMSLDDNQECEE